MTEKVAQPCNRARPLRIRCTSAAEYARAACFNFRLASVTAITACLPAPNSGHVLDQLALRGDGTSTQSADQRDRQPDEWP